MMRSIVWAVSCVCSVPKTRWPVSAAVSAVEIVPRSRISPTRITSGSCRSAAFSASAKLIASGPISRWLTMQRLCLCTNSIGSSTVRMCSARVRLISSIIAASVVDLPEPVGLALDLELLLLLAREDPVEQPARVVRHEDVVALEALDMPAHANHRRAGDRDVQVGSTARDQLLEQLIYGRNGRHVRLPRPR